MLHEWSMQFQAVYGIMMMLPETSQDGVLGFSNILLATSIADEEIDAVEVRQVDFLSNSREVGRQDCGQEFGIEKKNHICVVLLF